MTTPWWNLTKCKTKSWSLPALHPCHRPDSDIWSRNQQATRGNVPLPAHRQWVRRLSSQAITRTECVVSATGLGFGFFCLFFGRRLVLNCLCFYNPFGCVSKAAGTSQSLSHWRISHRPLGSQVTSWRERSVAHSALWSPVIQKWSSGHGRKLNKYLSLWWKKEWILKTVEIFETKVGQASPDALSETGGIWSLREDGLGEASERLKPWKKWHETLFTSLVLLGGKVLPRFLKVLLLQPLMRHIPGVVLKTKKMPYAWKLSAKTTL